jgi:hypothetical protein
MLVLFNVTALAADESNTILKEYEFTTEGNEFNYDAPLEIIDDGIKYQRKDIEYEVLSKVSKVDTKSKLFKVEKKKEGLKAKDDSVFKEYIDINEDGYKGKILLKEVTYEDKCIRGRIASHKVEYDYGLQVEEPKPISSLDTIYHDEETNSDVPVTLDFIELKQTEKPHWEHNIHVYQTYRSIYEDEYLLVDGTRLSFDSDKPQYEGIEDKILKQMRLDPEKHIISDSKWLTKCVTKDGLTSRLANYTIKRYVTGYAAIYSATFDVPDIVSYDATAIYESELTKKVSIGTEYKVKAIVTYEKIKPNDKKEEKKEEKKVVEIEPETETPPKKSNVAVIVGTSTGVIVLCFLVFLLRKRKKKNDETI